jgi:hypothetical protein
MTEKRKNNKVNYNWPVGQRNLDCVLADCICSRTRRNTLSHISCRDNTNSILNIGYGNAERYKCPPNEQFKYFIIYLETKFRPNRRIFVFWSPSLVPNGHHSKPKWSPYGAACLTPSKYPFPLKSVHFWIFNDFFKFLYWWPFWTF